MSTPPEIMTPAPTASAPAKPREAAAQPSRHVEEQLDEALDASFPASDPVSIVTSQAEEDWGAESDAGARSTAARP